MSPATAAERTTAPNVRAGSGAPASAESASSEAAPSAPRRAPSRALRVRRTLRRLPYLLVTGATRSAAIVALLLLFT